jgi:hypothetical protein
MRQRIFFSLGLTKQKQSTGEMKDPKASSENYAGRKTGEMKDPKVRLFMQNI